MSAPKQGNGFVGRRIVSSPSPRRNNLGEKFNDLSHMTQASSACPEHGSGSATKPRPARPVVRWTSRSMDQPRSVIGPPPAKAGRFESGATFVAVRGVYDAPPTKGGSRGQWHHRCWQSNRVPQSQSADRRAFSGVDGPSEPPIDKPCTRNNQHLWRHVAAGWATVAAATNRCRKNSCTWSAAAIPKFGPSHGAGRSRSRQNRSSGTPLYRSLNELAAF